MGLPGESYWTVIMSDKDALLTALNSKDWHVRRDAARNPSTPAEVLVKLATDEAWGVRKAVAENPRTPADALAILATDEDWRVRQAVAGNPNAPAEALAANNSMSVGGIGTALMNAIGLTSSASSVAAPVAVVLNVTAVSPTSSGYLTVYPASSARPTTSSVNFSPGTIQASQVVVDVGSGGRSISTALPTLMWWWI